MFTRLTQGGKAMSVDTASREIVSSRLLKASPDVVYEAWRNPALLAQWFGPEGFTNTFQSFDLRPEGVWEFVMHGPNGVDYPNKNIFVEVVEAERVVFDHVYAPVFRMTVTFAKTDDPHKTHFSYRMQFESEAVCQSVKAMCGPANEQNFDRLEAVLAAMP
jgi:uncharacterized protein YndB with AHSA1/START domain